MNKIKAAFAGMFSLVAVTAAVAQSAAPPNLPYHSVFGRLGAKPGDTGPGQAIPFATLSAQFASILAPGMAQNTLVGGGIITSAPTVNSTFCGLTAALGGSALYAFTVGAASGFPANCILTVINTDTGRGKTLSGFPSSLLPILWPGQTVQIANINNAWAVQINPGKWRPTSAVQFNVSPAGTDNGECLGTGSGGACATISTTQNLVCQNVDPSYLPNTINQLVIKVAAGAYTQNLNSICDPGPLPFVGVTQGGFLKISGDPSTPSNVTLNCGAAPCFSPVHSTAGWMIEGFQTSGTASSFVCDAGTHMYLATTYLAPPVPAPSI